MLGVAGLAALTMVLNRPPVEVQPLVITPPGVRVEVVTLRDVPLSVTSQGTVRPRTESQLVSEIAGRVTWVASAFAEGGFFELNDVLVKIDPFDYQQAIVSARSQLAQARLRLAQEEAEADVAVREWDALGRGDPRALTLREPQLEEARASLAGAEAGVERAERDLERADIVAPYAGRIRQKDVDIGQFVRVGDVVATIYAVDVAEVRLPLPDDQLAYLDLPLSYRGGADQPQPRVTLRATFAGTAHEWHGRIVRTEGEIDPVSRMVHAVAEVLDPYAPGPNQGRPPLAVGMYVEAEIAGRVARNIAVVPRAALRGRDRVLVVDAGSRLSFREIDILRATTDAIYVQHGLAAGELVVVSPLDAPTEGMQVLLAEADNELLAGRRGRTSADQPSMTNGVGVGALDGDTRMARAAPDDARALPVSEPTAPTPDSDRLSAAAADVDSNPTSSRDEQIAEIRRQLAALKDTPAAPSAPATDRPTAAPRRAADAGPDATNARLDTPAGTRGPGGADARTGRGARGRRGPGRGGPGAPERVERGDGPPATTPLTYPDTGPPPAEPTAEPAARPAGSADAAPSIAVLPFVNVSRNPADDNISTALTAALRTALEQTGAMGVVTLAAADESTALETAGGHGARWLVGGGYQRVGDRLRVTARVLAVAGGDLLHSVKLDGTVDELETLTTDMIAAVRAEIAGAGSALRTTTTRDPIPRADTNTLAVLPFDNLSPSGENVPDGDLGAAITAAVVDSLADLVGVTLVPVNDGAAWIVGGGVQRVGGVVRVTARLVDVESGSVLKAVKADGTIDALTELQARVASALRDSVREALSARDAANGRGAAADVVGRVGRQS